MNIRVISPACLELFGDGGFLLIKNLSAHAERRFITIWWELFHNKFTHVAFPKSKTMVVRHAEHLQLLLEFFQAWKVNLKPKDDDLKKWMFLSTPFKYEDSLCTCEATFFEVLFFVISFSDQKNKQNTFFHALGIQSPNLRIVMEPKYLSEEMIIHPLLII